MPRAVFALACALLLSGCPRQELFVVLPSATGGKIGGITVDDGQHVTLLDKPYAAAESRAGSSEPVEESTGDIGVIFRQAEMARPILPHHFRLYFILDSDRMTRESQANYRAVFDDIKERAAYEVEVIGYTDTLGSTPHNQLLSLARAAAIREELRHDGLERASISIAGRGKHDLLVPTGDQVAEPRNRRVEIFVR
jgi:outer membrane protein OmpA-like peptidoglycan-associated protein